jgi:hypothetical protein
MVLSAIAIELLSSSQAKGIFFSTH